MLTSIIKSGAAEKFDLLLRPPAPGKYTIAVDPGRQWLYVARRGESKISSYWLDQRTGALGLLGTVQLPTDPCYLATDRRGKFLLAAYYEGRGVSVHAIGDDGAVIDPPIERRETARGAHSIQTDPSNRFAFVPHIAGRGPCEHSAAKGQGGSGSSGQRSERQR